MSNSCLGAEGTEARRHTGDGLDRMGQSRDCGPGRNMGMAWGWRGRVLLTNHKCFPGLHSAEQGPWLELGIQVATNESGLCFDSCMWKVTGQFFRREV